MNMIDHKADHYPLIGDRPGRPLPFFIADGVYLLAVYVWTLALRPLGRDYAAMASPGDLGPFIGSLFSGMMGLFGSWVTGYHLVNLALLYGCMALILVLTRLLTRGPWWLGSVAAVLFMANPVKTEAVLNISGLRELVPALLGLLVLVTYASLRRRSGVVGWVPLLVYGLVIAVAPIAIMLFAVLFILEYTVFRETPNHQRKVLPFVVLGVAALVLHGQWSVADALRPSAMFAPLWLIVYPIGFLPHNAAFFAASPLSGWIVGITVVLCVVYVMVRTANRTFTFGLLGAVALRLFQGVSPVDPVSLSGGGRLILPAALFAVGLVGMFHMLLQQPPWRQSVVRITTVLCAVAMACQVWVNFHWIHAGREAARFQGIAEAATAPYPGEPIAIAPDIQYYRSAPMMLSDSIRYNTPFSKALPVVSILPMSFIPPMEIVVESYSSESIAVSVKGLAAPVPDLPRLRHWNWWSTRRPLPATTHMEERATREGFPARRINYPDERPP